MGVIKKLILLSVVLIISTSCYTTAKVSQIDTVELSSMVEDYYYHYGESPSFLENFLDYYKDKDSINATITYLTERKHDIYWTINNNSMLEEELLIKEKGDTLLWMSGKKQLPYLDDLINGYEKDYLDYPESLDVLIDYDQDTKGKKEDSFDRCIVATLRYLDKWRDQLTWQKNDSLFLLTAADDTISCRIGPSYSVSICGSDYLRETSVFLFYDNKGVVVQDDHLLALFRSGLRDICYSYKNERFEFYDCHVIQYTHFKGLALFCQNDVADLNTKYYVEIRWYLEQFANENRLSRIIFTVPALENTK